MPDIDWSKIRDVNDVIRPRPFPEHDRDGNPGEGTSLFNVDHGSRVVDSAGNRYLLMGHGSMQGTVILRDRYRRMFHAEGCEHYKRV